MKKLAVCIFCSLISVASFSEDFDNLFNDDTFIQLDIGSVEDSSNVFSFTHELGAQTIINVNSDKQNATERLYSGVTSTELSFQPGVVFQPNDNFTFTGKVELAVDGVFWLRENDAWSDADVSSRQYQVDIKESVAQVRHNNWQLSTGIQTVTLGLADALSLSNVLNAQDLTIPGSQSLDDAVIPAWTSMVSAALGSVRFRTGLVHRHQLNALPLEGTDFDSGLSAMLENAGLALEPEDFAFENMAGFASFSGVIGPLDWQVNAISQKEHTPVVELGVTGMGPKPIALYYPRTTTLGMAGSYVAGSVLWKAEAALVDGLQAQSTNGMMPGALVGIQRAGGTLGFDYTSNQLGRLVAEVQVTRILDYDSLNLMQTDEHSVQWVLMYSKNFLRERLTVTGQMIGFDIDSSGGRLQGVGIEYDVNDQLSAALRYIDYVAGATAFLTDADDRDRLLISALFRF